MGVKQSFLENISDRCGDWMERHPKILGILVIVSAAAIFTVAYYSTGSLYLALVYLTFSPFIIFFAIAFVGLVTIPPMLLVGHQAEKLVARGWPYWLAMVCLAPVGLLGVVVMVFLVDCSLSLSLPQR